jgi:hypothetical protein
MGYGARALETLNSFYSGDLLNLDEVMEEDNAESFAEAAVKVDKVRSHACLCIAWLGPTLFLRHRM